MFASRSPFARPSPPPFAASVCTWRSAGPCTNPSCTRRGQVRRWETDGPLCGALSIDGWRVHLDFLVQVEKERLANESTEIDWFLENDRAPTSFVRSVLQ